MVDVANSFSIFGDGRRMVMVDDADHGPKVALKPSQGILTTSNLPVCDYSANPYTGCTHACRYCYASFMKRFTGHEEPWGEFLDVKE